MKENYWKTVEKKGEKREGKREKGEKRKNRRKKEKREVKQRRKVERREQERREGWEAQRAEGLLHDIENVVGILPAMSRPPLRKKRPCSIRLGETQKCWKKQEKCKSEQSEHWFVVLGSAISGTKHEGTTWDRQRSCKSGPTVKKPPKMPQNMAKIDQKRVLCFRNLSARKVFAFT